MFTFLNVIRKKFEYNLRIFANFIVKTQNLWNSPLPFQKNTFFFIKDYIFYTKNLYFTTKDAPSFVKSIFNVTFLHF